LYFAFRSFKSISIILSLNKLKLLETYKDILALNKNNIKTVKRYEIKLSKQIEEMSYIYMFAKNVLRGKDSIIYQKLALKTKIKTVLIGLAIERFRLKYDKLPEKLNQLVPEVIKKLPNDPFTGKPFRYVVGDIELRIEAFDDNSYTGKYKHPAIIKSNGDAVYFIKRQGWMVYSFGCDQDDDNGTPVRKWSDNGDITFRCVRKNNK
jgi:hypothetical protein